MALKLVGTTLGRSVMREVFLISPHSMPGPYKCWRVIVRDTVMVGRSRHQVNEVGLTCHSKKMADRRIKQRLIVVP